MPIRWDPLLVRHLARELDALLVGARLRALRFDARTRDVALLFRERSLLWRLHPEHGMPLVRDPTEPQRGDQRLKARVRAVRAPLDERILLVELGPERAGQPPAELVVELMGNQLNALVTEGESRTIRHVLRRREGNRPVRVGQPYSPPPSTGRLGADGSLTLNAWLEILAPVPPPDRARELVRRIAWTSPINAATCLGEGGHGAHEAFPGGEAPAASDGPSSGKSSADADPGSPPQAGGGEASSELERGYHAWRRAVMDEGAARAVLLEGERGLQPYPSPVVGARARPVGSLLEAFEACAAEAGAAAEAEAALRVGPQLLERLQDAVEHAERRVVRLKAELDSREDPDALRGVGDLILARYGDIPHGASRAVLRSFAGEEVEVELDPKLEPHDNAASYYDRAARSERAGERLPGLIQEASHGRNRLRALLDAAGAGGVDAEEIRAALPATASTESDPDRGTPLPYRVFRSSGGLEIRVGRGAKHNDDLTFHHSAPDDVWMHARHAAGAHVVLRWSGEGSPPQRDLHEAGALAALHSKARTSGSAPVDWTRRKYVRKPRGAPPGSVVPDRVSTIFVAPDERLLEKLSAEG
jgi:predicted ribosome quality control (RQC) complex YloA/Tae2 family protein